MTEMISELSDAELDAVAAAGGPEAIIIQLNLATQRIHQTSRGNHNTATAHGAAATANAGNQTATQTLTQSNIAIVG